MLSWTANLINRHVLSRWDLQLTRRSLLPAELVARSPQHREPRRVLFFHPPKCGGTSVSHLLETAFGRADHLLPSASREAAVLTNNSLTNVREILLAYALQRRDIGFISGHFFFSERLIQDTATAIDLITILREPKARLLSEYYYNRFKSNREHFAIDCDLDIWLTTREAQKAALLFTRMFVGDADLSETLSQVDFEKALEAANQAIINLRSFCIVGTLEQYNEFAQELRERYTLDFELKHLNVNPATDYPSFENQPAYIQEQITELCAADTRVYEAFETP